MTAPAFTGTFTMVDPEHVAQVGPAAALLFARICWRAQQGNGSWAATRQDLQRETGLSDGMIRGALAALRDRDWLSSSRSSAQDATTVWTPVFAGQPDIANFTNSDSEINHLQMANSAISSIETSKTYPPTPQGSDDGGLFPDLAAAASQPVLDPLDGFDAWYAEYPRKTAKADARKAWGQALRAGAQPAAILAGLQAQVQELRDQHQRGFCPYPASWLRAGRWEDEVATVTPLRPTGAPQAAEEYDPAYEQTLPPPRVDPFAVGGGW